MALASTPQDDWGGGIYRSRRAPANAVYDAVNAILLDDGTLAKRGGSAYWNSANAGSTLARIATAYMPAPKADRVLAWGSRLYTFDATPAALQLLNWGSILGRPASVGGVMVFPDQTVANNLIYYGGSLKSADYVTGTATVANGSTAVTGAGTSWLANVDAGMILSGGSGGTAGVVASVNSDTSITLLAAWANTSLAASAYTLSRTLNLTLSSLPSLDSASRVASVGSPARLIMTIGNRVYLTSRGSPWGFDATTYHEMPAGMTIIGAEGVGDTAVIFGSTGVWTIQNMSLDVVDDFGNIQQSVARLNDLRLWGEAGVTAWPGGLIVAAVDDIHVMGLDGSSTPISADQGARGEWQEKVRPLYRSYTKTAGYQPGIPCVHRGHLFVPIMNGTTVVDSLVCRLDRGAGWTRWSGHAAGGSYAVRAGTTARAATLLSVNAERVTDLTATLDPVAANAQDADATTPDCTITTRDYATGGNQHGLVHRLRLRYELTDDGIGATAAPTVALAYSSDQDAGAFTTLTDKGLQGGGTGGAVSAGDKYNFWLVGKRRERIRFRITQSGAAASFILRSLEMLSRATGKQ